MDLAVEGLVEVADSEGAVLAKGLREEQREGEQGVELADAPVAVGGEMGAQRGELAAAGVSDASEEGLVEDLRAVEVGDAGPPAVAARLTEPDREVEGVVASGQRLVAGVVVLRDPVGDQHPGEPGDLSVAARLVGRAQERQAEEAVELRGPLLMGDMAAAPVDAAEPDLHLAGAVEEDPAAPHGLGPAVGFGRVGCLALRMHVAVERLRVAGDGCEGVVGHEGDCTAFTCGWQLLHLRLRRP